MHILEMYTLAEEDGEDGGESEDGRSDGDWRRWRDREDGRWIAGSSVSGGGVRGRRRSTVVAGRGAGRARGHVWMAARAGCGGGAPGWRGVGPGARAGKGGAASGGRAASGGEVREWLRERAGGGSERVTERERGAAWWVCYFTSLPSARDLALDKVF
jgi:hypothetical protein